MIRVIKPIIAVLVMSISVQAIEIKNSKQAINIAGKQRMLTQRLLANFVMIGMASIFKDPKSTLISVVREYEDNLQAILIYSKDKKSVLKEIDDVQKLWVDVKKMIDKEPSKESSVALSSELDKLLKESNDVVQAIKLDAGRASSEIVDVSGRQRMLSQRISGVYILSLWAEDKTVNQKLEDAMNSFELAMKKLYTYEKNTKDIEHTLKRQIVPINI